MRSAEWINTIAFSLLTILARLRPLHPPRRHRATSLGIAGLGLIVTGAGVIPRALPTLPASVFRDWLPYPLLLLFYWQAGQFFTQAHTNAERCLERLDERLVVPVLAWCKLHLAGRLILIYLEAAYLFCYPSLPLGLTALYLMHRGRAADHYWSVVTVSTYACYAALPFFQTRPPRTIAKSAVIPPFNPIRRLNLLILRHASIQVNTFPSAHAAGSLACALVLLQIAPPVGLAFLALALSIALGAALGRYHYAADVILGALLALAVFLVGRAVLPAAGF